MEWKSAGVAVAGAAAAAIDGAPAGRPLGRHRGGRPIRGLAGVDIFRQGRERLLSGGLAGDSFVFDTRPDSVTNVDRIADFAVGTDRIQLENDIFTALGSGSPSSPTVLGASHFFVGAAAHDADDFVIYNPATGALSYDADGSGSGAALTFAQVTAGLGVTYSDLFVI